MTPVQIELSALYAEWFAAVGTVGALFLGVAILARDHQQERQASADALVSWTQTIMTVNSEDEEKWRIHVHAYNSGDRPIPSTIIMPRPGFDTGRLGHTLSRDPIVPGATVSTTIELTEEPEGTPLWLVFQDARSQRWVRDLQKQEYVSKRTIRKLYRKYGNVRGFSRHLLFPR